MAAVNLSEPASHSDSLIRATDLGRRHPEGPGWLFQQIEMEVGPGDRLALVGPTGSGKSLVLRALALLDPVDRGEILWRDRPVADTSVPIYRGQVLYLQQRSPVIEGTVEDNLRVPFSLHLRRGSSLPLSRAAELLRALGRDETFLANRTTNLSGGERQIVALMRALLVAPSVLLLDEPTAALDPEASATLERLVRSWQAEAPVERAFVWVSHDPAQAQRIADRIIHLQDGQIEDSR